MFRNPPHQHILEDSLYHENSLIFSSYNTVSAPFVEGVDGRCYFGAGAALSADGITLVLSTGIRDEEVWILRRRRVLNEAEIRLGMDIGASSYYY
jgi:hypothetical protein